MKSTTLHTASEQDTRLRLLIWAGTALAVAVLAASLLWLAAPELSPYAAHPNPAPVQHLFNNPGSGQTAAAALLACTGAATSALGLTALFGRRAPIPVLGGVAVGSGALSAFGLVGLNGLAFAGYTLAHALPLLIVTLVVLAVRRPAARVLVTLTGAGLCAFLIAGPTPFQPLYREMAALIMADPVSYVTPLMVIPFAGVWLLIGMIVLGNAEGPVGTFVLQHRVAITVLAAGCSLPYLISRLSWLTPWPLLGNPQDYDDAAEVLTTGLILGAAMLVGGILTLGLILPWGTRFPRWFGRSAGRPVPVAWAVIPASIVAVLFTAGGIDSLLIAAQAGDEVAIPLVWMALALPFWLWGPLLGLATWGYALHRRSGTGATQPRGATDPVSLGTT